jgi:hypothetical protein
MSERATPVLKPRFPWPVALVCVATLGVAIWTWMGYSHAWQYSGQGLVAACTRSDYPSGRGATDCPDNLFVWSHPGLVGKYVSIDDTLQGSWSMNTLWGVSLPVEDTYVAFLVSLPRGTAPQQQGHSIHYRGRMVPLSRWVAGGDSLVLDTTASRFTWQSITGLVVGAIGVFVFVFFLWRWLNRRRAVCAENAEVES